MKFINIKEKIKIWLFKQEVNQYREAIEILHNAKNDFKNAENKFEEFRKDINCHINKAEGTLALALDKVTESQKLSDDTRTFMNSICEVGVDVHRSPYENSWAVICIHGKMDYVKFVSMNQSDIRHIASFLKQFERSNIIIDTPVKGAVEDLLLRW